MVTQPVAAAKNARKTLSKDGPSTVIADGQAASAGKDLNGRNRKLSIIYRRLSDLEPYTRNARTHTAAQIDKLQASLAAYGWTNPLLTAGNSLLAGHARLAAAMAMAEAGQAVKGNPDPAMAPTVDLSHLTAAERRAYIIADNRLALDAGWDADLLRFELGGLEADGFNLGLTGFNLTELQDMMSGGPAAPDGFNSYDEDIEVEHVCPKCGYQFSAGQTVPKSTEGSA